MLVILLTAAAIALVAVRRQPLQTPSEPQPPVEPAPAARRPVSSLTAGVYPVNADYDRVESRVFMRRIVGPTRARLDFAAYDSNVMLLDPAAYRPDPPDGKVSMADLSFDGALDGDTLCDRIADTPLTAAERACPLAWRPASDHLIKLDEESEDGGDDALMDLLEVGAAVSGHKWNDPNIIPPYQEIACIYVHRTDAPELWAKVEFKPWVSFLQDVDDEDGDGFPEIYARIPAESVPASAVQALLGDYSSRVLSVDEVNSWAYALGSDWYPSYFTYTLKPEPTDDSGGGTAGDGLDIVEVPALPGDELSALPDGALDSIPAEELASLREEHPAVVIWGTPFKQPIWNFFYISDVKPQD